MEASLKWQLVCTYWQMGNTSELVKVLQQLGGGRISRRVQLFLLEEVFHNKVSRQYPPDIAYSARLLKLVILAAEKEALKGGAKDSDEEEEPVLEALYAEHAKHMETVSCMDDVDGLEAKWCYRTYAYTTPRELPAPEEQSQSASVDSELRPITGLELAEDAPSRTSDGSCGKADGHSRNTGGDSDSANTNPAADLNCELAGLANTIRSDHQCDFQHAANGPSKRDSLARQSGPDTSPCLTRLVTVRVSLNLFEGGTGCTTWSAGFCLAEFALTHPETFVGKRVLELGAGAGVLGVVMARLPGVKELILTDGNDETLDNLERNLRLNGVKSTQRTGANDTQNRPMRGGKPGKELSKSVANPGVDQITHPVRSGSKESVEGSVIANGAEVISKSVESDSGETRVTEESIKSRHGAVQDWPTVRCERLDWEDVAKAQLRAYDADVILGADVLYDPGVIPDLVRILLVMLAASQGASDRRQETALSHGSVTTHVGRRLPRRVAFVATALRNESTLDSFVTAVKEAELSIELVESRERQECFQYCEWMNRDRIRLHRIS